MAAALGMALRGAAGRGLATRGATMAGRGRGMYGQPESSTISDIGGAIGQAGGAIGGALTGVSSIIQAFQKSPEQMVIGEQIREKKREEKMEEKIEKEMEKEMKKEEKEEEKALKASEKFVKQIEKRARKAIKEYEKTNDISPVPSKSVTQYLMMSVPEQEVLLRNVGKAKRGALIMHDPVIVGIVEKIKKQQELNDQESRFVELYQILSGMKSAETSQVNM